MYLAKKFAATFIFPEGALAKGYFTDTVNMRCMFTLSVEYSFEKEQAFEILGRPMLIKFYLNVQTFKEN